VLTEPVDSIQQDDQCVTAFGSKNNYKAKYCIIALPLNLAGRIKYSPPLPTEKDGLLQRVPLGSGIKCYLIYKTAFWIEKSYSGQIISDIGPISASYDDTDSEGKHPALVGFMGGNMARIWRSKTKEQRQEAVTKQYAHMFNCEEALHPIEYIERDWNAEIYTRGCIGFMSCGTLTQYGPYLRTPCGRLHWAGTETATKWQGYMDGAVQAGERAAKEVEDLLKSNEGNLKKPRRECKKQRRDVTKPRTEREE